MMEKNMSRVITRTIGTLFLISSNACTMSHLSAGQEYVKRGNLPLAVEYFDAGLKKTPNDQELRDAFILAEQTYQWQLRDEIDRLKEAKVFLPAIGKLMLLNERSRRMGQLSLPGDEAASVIREQVEVTKEAQKYLMRDLDERANRARILLSDLRACRQLQVFDSSDTSLKRRCDRLLKTLKLYASIRISNGSSSLASPLSSLLGKKIMNLNPELIEFIKEDSNQKNSHMHIYVGSPSHIENPWTLTQRDAYRKWIEKKDSKGRPIKKQVTTHPTKDEIEKAKKEKKPVPQPKTVWKKAYQQVKGEYLRFEASRQVKIPYRVRIENLQSRTTVFELENVVDAKDVSHYYEFRGDPRAVKAHLKSQTGRATAKPLSTQRDLMNQAANKTVNLVSKAILERIE